MISGEILKMKQATNFHVSFDIFVRHKNRLVYTNFAINVTRSLKTQK